MKIYLMEDVAKLSPPSRTDLKLKLHLETELCIVSLLLITITSGNSVLLKEKLFIFSEKMLDKPLSETMLIFTNYNPLISLSIMISMKKMINGLGHPKTLGKHNVKKENINPLLLSPVKLLNRSMITLLNSNINLLL